MSLHDLTYCALLKIYCINGGIEEKDFLNTLSQTKQNKILTFWQSFKIVYQQVNKRHETIITFSQFYLLIAKDRSIENKLHL